ncbi:MAG: hypothetical protein ACJ763_19685 [Bdellovibrionia bacterium]
MLNPMASGPQQYPVQEAGASAIERSSISWRAIFAGFFISFLVYMILTSLGLAIGGASLKGVVQGQGGGAGLSIGSGVWLVVTALISLFVGSYLAGRVSGLVTSRIGGVQGMVVAALFFAFMISQVGALVGSVGSGLGNVIGSAGTAASNASSNPQVQAVIQERLGDLNLKSPPDQVAQGLATRLVRGDAIGARNYLASQAGISRAEADRRINQFKTDFQNKMQDVGTAAAKAVSIAGWTLFGVFALGTGFSVLGGSVGAKRNLSVPVSDADRRRMTGTRAA